MYFPSNFEFNNLHIGGAIEIEVANANIKEITDVEAIAKIKANIVNIHDTTFPINFFILNFSSLLRNFMPHIINNIISKKDIPTAALTNGVFVF